MPNTRMPNAWVRAVAPKNLAGIIREAIHRPFRRVEIKRRQISDALYESDWLDITQYVTKYGTMERAVDDIQLNRFTHSGVQLSFRNDYGEFNPEYDGQSIFNGYLTRARTLVRVSAGYTDGAGNQFPTDATQGIFLMDGEIEMSPGENNTRINCKSILSPFEETRASQISGITDSITASEIIEKIRDSTDGSGNFLFRTFITSTAWTIESTTALITTLGTSTALDAFSVWDLMERLAEAEGFVLHATRSGGISFTNRDPNSIDPSFALYGASYRKPNIIKLKNVKEAVNKLYTFFRFKWQEEDTSTSYITGGTSTSVDPRSPQWVYGARTYEMENTFFTSSSTAQQVISRLASEFSDLKIEMDADVVFIPHVDVLDRVSVSYREGPLGSTQLWNTANWAADTTTSDTYPTLSWASETSGSIDFVEANFKVMAVRTNLDTFATTFTLREV